MRDLGRSFSPYHAWWLPLMTTGGREEGASVIASAASGVRWCGIKRPGKRCCSAKKMATPRHGAKKGSCRGEGSAP
ncbi:hypothetical protein OBBRIDRAFT_413072 [Obba rivulosa]|uniref:Uncharacterized protein n=1 Tax=Obba rivulosa TaxID=1052685 RepID=A0A8E2DJ40_9APHY|nr:hypothetical protein OBBRIDRAFT_413072 [Obba rivulosa]